MLERVSGVTLRKNFPIFEHNTRRSESGEMVPLRYLDSAATAQKPKQVIDAMTRFLERDYGTVHRGAYDLSARSSTVYEAVRSKVAQFVGGSVKPSQVVFVRGTTEGLNLLAHGISEIYLESSSRIVVPVTEHHANLIPWQQAALRCDCELAYIPLVGRSGAGLQLNLAEAERLITANTKVVSFAHVGNVLGQINPVAELVALAKSRGALVVLDCAQSIASLDDDPFAFGVDAIAFSGHKMYGPTGVGCLILSDALARDLPPFLFGGGMISTVTLDESTWSETPSKFEAGTPPIVEVIGLGAAIDWLQAVGRKALHEHAAALATRFAAGLSKIPGIEIFSPGTGKETLVSFRHRSLHAHDLATMLDSDNVAVRAGHHCAWPLVQALGVDALVRASFAAYSDVDDVEAALFSINNSIKKFA